MAKEVFVDQDECTGCELCVDALPEVFEMTSDGVSKVHNSAGADEDKIQDIIDSCPAECIHWK
ncbi:MAG TPA: ferredoxin [Spirochaetota bacterium]|nr:ferredoxin [Spirochaetota bacterium]HPJ37995.1 ferredoxin [Spirochaetota bacterium]HPQ53012.1 ferredoxin [Spirochaetota bacterium]